MCLALGTTLDKPAIAVMGLPVSELRVGKVSVKQMNTQIIIRCAKYCEKRWSPQRE